MFCGEKTFLKKGSFPRTPFSKNFRRDCFYYYNKSNPNLFIISKLQYFFCKKSRYCKKKTKILCCGLTK